MNRYVRQPSSDAVNPYDANAAVITEENVEVCTSSTFLSGSVTMDLF